MFKKMLAWTGRASAVSAVVVAVGGAPLVLFLGPSLAMGLSMYSGQTEPVSPSLDMPWGLLLILIVGSVGCLVGSFWKSVLSAPAVLLATLAIVREVYHVIELMRLAMGQG